MKLTTKLFFSFLFASLFYISISAEEMIYKIDDQVNDYALYADNRNGNTILGIMFDGNDTYIVRKYNIDTRVELIYRISFKFTETQISTKNYSILKGKDTGDYSDLLDLTLIIQARDKVNFSDFPEDIHINQNYDNNKNRKYIFKFWVPVLNLYSIDFGNNKKLQLIDMGRTKQKQKSRFYTMTQWPENISGPSYKIPAADKMKIQYDELSLDIDKNWKQDGDSLVLSISTPRDALISFSNYTFDQEKGDIIKTTQVIGIIKLLFMDIPIIAESLKVQTNNNCVIFDYYVYNQDDNMSTHIFDVYKVLKNNRIDNITLYSYSTLYQNNFEYFVKIIKKVIGEES